MKNKIRCGYCHQHGHNITGCPTLKQDAANGNAYAQNRVSRNKVKKCSYCHTEGHTKATCETKFSNELNEGWKVWAGINGAMNIIRDRKIAKGAFIYGPILHRWEHVPRDKNYDGKSVPNYELINFCVEDVYFSERNIKDEWGSHFTYTTLTDLDSNVRLSTTCFLPGLKQAIDNLDSSFEKGKKLWADDMYSNMYASRNIVEETFNVLIEAPQENVDSAIKCLLELKPMIVDYTDRKQYQSAIRILKKSSENSSNNNFENEDE